MAAPSADCWRVQSQGSDSSDNDHDDVSGDKISAERSHRQEERFAHSKRQQQASKNIKYDHPIYQEISRENGLINKMDIDELSRKLKQCGLNSRCLLAFTYLQLTNESIEIICHAFFPFSQESIFSTTELCWINKISLLFWWFCIFLGDVA